MLVKPRIKPDFVKALKKYKDVTVTEIFRAMKEANKEYNLEES